MARPAFRSSLTALAALLLVLAGCQGDVESRLAEIRALQDAGQFEQSIEPLRGLVTTNSANPEVNYRLGIALVQTGRRSLAIWPLQKAAQSQEYALQGGILLATTLLSTSDYEEAIRAADRVLAIDPDNRAALFTRAQANINASHAEGALESAERLLELNPDDPRALSYKIGALIDLERFDEAEKLQLDLRERAEESGDAKLGARACGALIVFYAGSDRDEEAARMVGECLDAYPDDPTVRTFASNYLVEHDGVDEAAALWRAAIEEHPEDPQLRSRLANLLLKAGRTDEAEQVLDETVELFDTVDAWRAMAAFYRNENRIPEARKAIEEAIERSAGNTAALEFELGDLLVGEGDLDRARAIADALEEPAYVELLRGSIALADGDPKAALAYFESGMRRWPNNAGARFLAGEAAAKLGDMPRARAEYREAVRNDATRTDAALRLARIHLAQAEYKAALDMAQRQIDSRPFEGPEPYLIAARAAAAEGKWDTAQKALSQLAGIPGQQVVGISELARVIARQHGPREALRGLDESGLDPFAAGNEAILRAKIEFLIDAGRASEALALARQALEASPTSALAHDLVGRVYLSQGRIDDAKAAFSKALEIEADYADALAGIGTVAMRERRWKDAIASFEAAAHKEPRNGEYLYRIAQAKLAQGDRDAAIADLQKVVELDPANVGASNDLAWLLSETGGDLEQALTLARRAARIAPGAVTLDTLGWVYFKRGDGDAAARVFERAIAEYGESPSRLYHLGLALGQQGETERAIDTLRKALAGDSSFPESEAAHAELSRLEALASS